MKARITHFVTRIRDLLQHHSDEDNHIEIEIPPVDHPLKMVALGAFGAVGLMGVPVAMLLPIVPTAPFVLVALVCLARISGRFRRWLMATRLCKMTLSMIYTRPEPVFAFLRRLLQLLLGNPTVRFPRTTESASSL